MTHEYRQAIVFGLCLAAILYVALVLFLSMATTP